MFRSLSVAGSVWPSWARAAPEDTLALSLLKLLPRAGHIAAGRVLLNGRDLMAMSDDELRHVRKDVGMVFQDPMTSLNPVIGY